MNRILFSIIIFLISTISGYSQKKFTNPAKASELKQEYEEERIVALFSNSTYAFETKENDLKINHSDKVKLISLRSNVKYSKSIFYDDHVEIKSSGVRYASGRGVLKNDKVCGNYEIEDIFYSDAKICTYYFDLLYEASEVGFSSERIYKDPKYLTKVFFHEQDPTLRRKISFEIPSNVDVELVEMNFSNFEIERKVDKTEGGKKHTYTVKDIDALKSESNSLGFLHHYPHIIVITKGYETAGGRKNVLSSVDDLYAWYADLVENVEVDRGIFREKVNELTAQAKTDEEKIKNVYYWVQENIKYIAFEDGIAAFKPEAPQNVFRNRYGDCKGMAILTKEMLTEAGFDARLTWIGTNKIPYNYDLPSFAVDNHMICTVNHNGKDYVLDPTEKFIALGKHAERIQGKEMLIENGMDYIRKSVPVNGHNENLISRTENFKIENGKLIGSGKLNIEGESKKMILYYSNNSRVEDQQELFDYLSVSVHNNDDEVKVSKIPKAERDLPLEINYNYQLNNKVTSFGNDLYIEFDWEKTYSGLIMDEDRFSDYYFGRKVFNKTEKVIEIPKGYKVTHLPGAWQESFNDVSVQINFQQDKNSITYSSEVKVENGIISRSDFESWNELVKKLKEVYNDQIVFTKI